MLNVILSESVTCLPALHCQLRVLVGMTLFVAVSIFLGGLALCRALKHHRSRPAVVSRMKGDIAEFGWKGVTDEQIWRLFCELIVIGVQHLLGGLAVLPALFGLGDPAWTHPLAMVGCISEVAYDLYDSFRSLYRYSRGSLPGGRPALIFMLLHHQLSIALVLPMNLHYGSNGHFLHMALNLMGAGGVALFVSHAGQMLDLRSRRDLLAMRALATLQFAIMLYTRVLAYVPLSYLLLRTLWADGCRVMFWGGLACALAMAVFNALLLPSMYRRMRKMCTMTEADFAAKTEQVADADADAVDDTMAAPAAASPVATKGLGLPADERADELPATLAVVEGAAHTLNAAGRHIVRPLATLTSKRAAWVVARSGDFARLRKRAAWARPRPGPRRDDAESTTSAAA